MNEVAALSNPSFPSLSLSLARDYKSKGGGVECQMRKPKSN